MNVAPTLLTHPEFADIDRHFARFINDFGEGELPAIAAAMLSRNIRHGHICLDLVKGPVHFDEPPADIHLAEAGDVGKSIYQKSRDRWPGR